MKKKVITKNAKTREEMAMPYKHLSLNERLVKSNAVDLTDNCKIEQQGHYLIFTPIDESKKIKRDSATKTKK